MILLRKQADELLKEAGLDERFTVKRVDKCIYLTEQCGKPVVKVSDLKVGTKLSKIERNIIIKDYLVPLLSKKELLNIYIDLGNSIREQNEMLEETMQKLNVRKSYTYYNSNLTFYTTYTKNGIRVMEVSIDEEPSLFKDMLISVHKIPSNTLQTLLKTKYKGMVEKLEIVKNIYLKIREMEKEQTKLQKELGLIC